MRYILLNMYIDQMMFSTISELIRVLVVLSIYGIFK